GRGLRHLNWTWGLQRSAQLLEDSIRVPHGKLGQRSHPHGGEAEERRACLRGYDDEPLSGFRGSSEVATPQAGKRQPAICITEPSLLSSSSTARRAESTASVPWPNQCLACASTLYAAPSVNWSPARAASCAARSALSIARSNSPSGVLARPSQR